MFSVAAAGIIATSWVASGMLANRASINRQQDIRDRQSEIIRQVQGNQERITENQKRIDEINKKNSTWIDQLRQAVFPTTQPNQRK